MRAVRWLAVNAAFAAVAAATTWVPAESECPVCGARDEFSEVASYGSYIYQWPSKYQLIFWPFTDGQVLYACSSCRFTWFMGDDNGVSDDHREKLRAAVASVDYGGYDQYYDIPMPLRLKAAEKCYGVLGRDELWWCHFYRVQGYWLDAAGDAEGAKEARVNAYDAAGGAALFPENDGKKKEIFFIKGAMLYFLGDSAAASAMFKDAAALAFNDPEATAENNKGYDEYLTALIADFDDKIEKGDGPVSQ